MACREAVGPPNRPHRSGSGQGLAGLRHRLEARKKLADLAPRLRGKLHIATGSLDTFYLNGAVEKLAETLKRLGSDAQITIVPGADHGRVRTPEYLHQAWREMTARFEAK